MSRRSSSRVALLRWIYWFLLGNALVLLALFTSYLKVMPRPEDFMGQVFAAVAAPGHALTLAFVPALLVVPLALALPRARWIWAVTALASFALALAVWVDASVFRLYRFHLNGMVWNLVTGGATREVLPITGATWLTAALQLAALAGAEGALAWLAWVWVRRNRKGWGVRLAVPVLLLVAAGHGLHAWADASGRVSITRQVRYLPAYHPLTAKRQLRRLGVAVAAREERIEVPREASALNYPAAALTFRPDAPRYNLLIVAVESLRHDFLAPDVTPNLWRFSKSSVVFDHHFSSGNCTRFGVFGLFYGLYGPYYHAMLAEGRSPLLMDTIVDRGYSLGVFASAPLTSPELDRTAFARVRDRIPLRTEGADCVERDRNITGKFLHFLDERPRDTPFFGFLFYDSPHSYSYPPDAPEPFQPVLKSINYLELNRNTDPVPYRNRLKNSIHFVDGLLGNILDRLAALNLLDSTVVVVTGDHGQEFNETGLNYWGHNGNFSEYQTQVAMVLHWPGREPGHVGYPTNHVDIAPTLLADLFGCTTDPAEYSHGKNLFDPSQREFMLISNWNSFALVQADRIDVVEPTGEVDSFHPDYRQWADAPAEPGLMLHAMQALGRFYAR